MLRTNDVKVFNFEGAIRGMRNAMASWDKSDSYFTEGYDCGVTCDACPYRDMDITVCGHFMFYIGPNDLALAMKLVKSGTDHSKFMRQIGISLDITAPLYFFKEFDTYKIGTVANSTSTMHKLGSRSLTVDDFSIDEVDGMFLDYLADFNELIAIWRADKSEANFRNMIQRLLDSFNQTRTVTLNYAVARNMYHARKNHKLKEWRDLCSLIETLPYSELITCQGVM